MPGASDDLRRGGPTTLERSARHLAYAKATGGHQPEDDVHVGSRRARRDDQATPGPADEGRGAGDPVPGSEHLVRKRAQGRIGAPRTMEELPQFHGDEKQNREQPRDHAALDKRGIHARVG